MLTRPATSHPALRIRAARPLKRIPFSWLALPKVQLRSCGKRPGS